MLDTTRVLVLGENTFPFHSFDEKRAAFEAALGTSTTVETTTDRERLTDLTGFDVLVDYLTDSTLTPGQLDGVLEFVTDGGGYVPIHCAADLTSVAASDPEDVLDSRADPFPELRELVGGHFLNHPEQADFGVSIVAAHPVTDGVDDFRIYDEPYEVAWDTDDVTVLATMDHPDLDEYPVLWVKRHGEGRVCYCSLGHTDEAFETDQFRRILRNAVDWASAEGTSTS